MTPPDSPAPVQPPPPWRAIPIGPQQLALSPEVAAHLLAQPPDRWPSLVALRVRIERRGERLVLHIGEIEVGASG